MEHRVIGAYQRQRKHIGAYQWHIKCFKAYQRHMELFEAKSSGNEAFQSISVHISYKSSNVVLDVAIISILSRVWTETNSPKLWMSYQTYRRCSGISVRMWFIHFWMTTWQKSPTSGSSIHPRLGEVRGRRQSIAGSKHIPFTISGKGPNNPINTRVQEDSFNNK